MPADAAERRAAVADPSNFTARARDRRAGGHYMDYNRWNGSLEQLWAYFGRNKPRLAACPLDSFPCERAGLVRQEESVMQEVAV